MLTSNKVNESTTFYDLQAAEWAVSQALQKKRLKILIYSRAKFLLMRPEYRFDIELGREVGWGITKQNPEDVVHLSKIRVVLKMTEYNHMP
ncbi:RNase A-like domain-containing protein [Xanthomonas sp. WHRI 1810A]|uniref:RNase A-like domain-containing protein n=1 Tax=Xanthomonas sp. WHRI 1810A TaxID=3161565 RepID=UPI0032E8D5CF